MTDDINEPLVLADGTKIDPVNGSVVQKAYGTPSQYIEVPSATQLKSRYAAARRRMEDLPDAGNRMNAISLVVVYTMYGLGEKDISALTGLSEDQITYIRDSDSFIELHNKIIESIVDQDMDDIRGLIHAEARESVRRVAWLRDNATSDKVMLEASKDILDRDGFRPVDVVEHRLSLEEDDLRVRVIKKDDTKEINKPIDTEFVEL